MNLKEIKEMINLMKENDLAELELERDGLKIRLKKNSGQIEQIITDSSQKPAIEARAAKEENALAPRQGLIEIKSPMVGSFYRAPSPETTSFVDIGSEIQPEQVICIIEAMKLMNEIKSEIRGKILEILVDNAEPVEFGQSLFLIDPL